MKFIVLLVSLCVTRAQEEVPNDLLLKELVDTFGFDAAGKSLRDESLLKVIEGPLDPYPIQEDSTKDAETGSSGIIASSKNSPTPGKPSQQAPLSKVIEGPPDGYSIEPEMGSSTSSGLTSTSHDAMQVDEETAKKVLSNLNSTIAGGITSIFQQIASAVGQFVGGVPTADPATGTTQTPSPSPGNGSTMKILPTESLSLRISDMPADVTKNSENSMGEGEKTMTTGDKQIGGIISSFLPIPATPPALSGEPNGTTVPTLPQVPAAPMVPALPEDSAVPMVPAVPGLPAVPMVPTIPGVPAVPTSPSVPAESETLKSEESSEDATKTSENNVKESGMPLADEASLVGGGISNIVPIITGAIPALPTIPTVPAVPTAPSVPEVPKPEESSEESSE